MKPLHSKLTVVIIVLSIFCFISCKQNDNDNKKILATNHTTLEVADKIDAYMIDIMDRYGIPGASVAIIQNQQVTFQKDFGLSNLELNTPINSKSIYQVSSISKVFAATAIFQLIQDQKVHLDDAISKYIDDLPESWKAIKVSNLLSHTSGLPEIARYLESPEAEAKEKVYKDNIVFKPGENARYTNTNYWIVRRIIEKVSNTSFEEFVINGQFNHANNSAVYAGNFKDIVQNRATSYEPNQQGVFEYRAYDFPAYLYGAAGLNLSINDFIKWQEALDSYKLLDEDTVEKMWEKFTLNNGEEINFTSGWFARDVKDRKSVGFSGGYNTGFRKFIEDDLTVIILTNGYEIRYNIERLVSHIAGIVDADLENNESQVFENVFKAFLSDIKTGLSSYQSIKETRPELDYESILNSIAYRCLSMEKADLAIELFTLNTKEYPNSWNVFDSLGEAYESTNKYAEAIVNYKKSLELNPDNDHAVEKIKELQQKVAQPRAVTT